MNYNQEKLAISGNRDALEILLKESYQQLYKTAFLYMKNEADALDVVQEAVIKIMLKINTLVEPAYFVTWAVRIVIYTSLDALRKNKKEVLSEEIELTEEQSKLSKSTRLDLYDGLGLLSQDLQVVTILYYFHGCKLQEISELSGDPLGTTKYKLHQARKLLRTYLEGVEKDED